MQCRAVAAVRLTALHLTAPHRLTNLLSNHIIPLGYGICGRVVPGPRAATHVFKRNPYSAQNGQGEQLFEEAGSGVHRYDSVGMSPILEVLFFQLLVWVFLSYFLFVSFFHISFFFLFPSFLSLFLSFFLSLSLSLSFSLSFFLPLFLSSFFSSCSIPYFPFIFQFYGVSFLSFLHFPNRLHTLHLNTHTLTHIHTRISLYSLTQ